MATSNNEQEDSEHNSIYPTTCEMERSKDELAYGRERPRLWLPREITRAGRSRPLRTEGES